MNGKEKTAAVELGSDFDKSHLTDGELVAVNLDFDSFFEDPRSEVEFWETLEL